MQENNSENIKINSLKDLENINRRDLFNSNNNLHKNLDFKIKAKIVRILADFKIDLRKKPTNNQKRKVNKLLKEIPDFFDNKIKIIKPRKNNRKYYSEYTGISKKFKYYPVQVSSADEEIKIENKKIITKTKYYNSEYFKFENRKRLVKNPLKEIKKLHNEIKKEKRKIDYIKIKCGKALFPAKLKDIKQTEIQINKLINAYGDDCQNWLNGLVVYNWKNQENIEPENKKKKFKNLKFKKKIIRKRKFKVCKYCKTKDKCIKMNKCIRNK